jgi:hypothetical protein
MRRWRPAAVRRWQVQAAAAMVIVVALMAIEYFDPGQILSRPAATAGITGSGFAWIDEPAPQPMYVPADYLFNSARPHGVVVFRHGRGYYAVVFAGLDTSGGAPQASAYGFSPGDCSVGQWFPAIRLEIAEVLCFDAGGRPADVPFVINFSNRSQGTGPFSYLFDDRPGQGEPYRPPSWNRYDSTGGTAWVWRKSTGRYLAYVPASRGIAPGKQFYQVSAFAGPAYCKLAATPAASGVQAIDCRDATGAFADWPFILTFSSGTSIVGRTDRRYGYVSSADGHGIVRISPGYYEVEIHGTGNVRHAANASFTGGQVVAYATGDSDAYCHIDFWNSSYLRPDIAAWVKCWSISTGRPADSAFWAGASW